MSENARLATQKSLLPAKGQRPPASAWAMEVLKVARDGAQTTRLTARGAIAVTATHGAQGHPCLAAKHTQQVARQAPAHQALLCAEHLTSCALHRPDLCEQIVVTLSSRCRHAAERASEEARQGRRRGQVQGALRVYDGRAQKSKAAAQGKELYSYAPCGRPSTHKCQIASAVHHRRRHRTFDVVSIPQGRIHRQRGRVRAPSTGLSHLHLPQRHEGTRRVATQGAPVRRGGRGLHLESHGDPSIVRRYKSGTSRSTTPATFGRSSTMARSWTSCSTLTMPT